MPALAFQFCRFSTRRWIWSLDFSLVIPAVLSLLAGDIAEDSPIRFRLFLFKTLFYAKTLLAKAGRPFKPAPSASLEQRS